MKSLRESLLDTTPEDDIASGLYVDDDGDLVDKYIRNLINPDGVLTIPNGCRRIGFAQFRGRRDIKSIIFPSTVEEIGDQAFYRCRNLTSIKFPDKVDRLGIGRNAFTYCGIKEVNLPEGLYKLHMDCFSYNPIKKIYIPKTLSTLQTRVFLGCFDLEEVDFQSTILNDISEEVFSGCTKLKKIVLPKNVKSIGYRAFYDSGIKEIEAPGVDVLLDNALNGCSKLERASFSKEIFCNSYAFSGCKSLKEIDSIFTKIDSNCFDECNSLKSIKVYKDTYIAPKGFDGCTGLKDIYVIDDGKKKELYAQSDKKDSLDLSSLKGVTIHKV